jgi:hypothetical protein
MRNKKLRACGLIVALLGTMVATLVAQPQRPPRTRGPATRPSPEAPLLPPARPGRDIPAATQPGPSGYRTKAYDDVSRARRNSVRPDPVSYEMPGEIISDAEIERAIQRAIEGMAQQFDPAGAHLRQIKATRVAQLTPRDCGLNALCVYALIQAGRAVDDQRLKEGTPLSGKLIDTMKRMPADGPGHQTYALALRAAALSVFNRPDDREQLALDVNHLIHGHTRGVYSYQSAVLDRISAGRMIFKKFQLSFGDHSNSQYGLLGVWCGAEAGVEVPDAYWRAVYDHWLNTQSVTGKWGYSAPLQMSAADLRANDQTTTLSMTAAGLASLFVAGEHVERLAGPPKVGRDPFSPPVKLALDWWETGQNSITIEMRRSLTGHTGYVLYGIERVGLASGLKFFGDNDWYRLLSRQIVDEQGPDGLWNSGELVNSAYAILFLARGRHPIFMNKLRFGGRSDLVIGYWNNRPRDIDYLTRFASRSLERDLNWQIVPLRRDWSDWLDAPILYIASHQKPRFTTNDIEKLRHYVEAGGMLFTNADSDGDAAKLPVKEGVPHEFDHYISELAAQLFPNYEFKDLPPDHPVFTTPFKLDQPPKLRGVFNGSRYLLIHSPQDLAIKWQMRDEKKDMPAFQLGVNLFSYATGREDLRHRLDTPYVPDADENAPLGRVPILRLQYAGNWSPETRAWERFGNLMQWKTGTGIEIQTTKWAELKPSGQAFAHVTGTAKYEPSPEEMAATKAFVEEGGLLLIDECGGNGQWIASIRRALDTLWPNAERLPMAPDHPILRGGEPGMFDNLKMRGRTWTNLKATAGEITRPEIQLWRVGNGIIVLCPADLTSGLLGVNASGINGFEPDSSERFVRNLIFWNMDKRP